MQVNLANDYQNMRFKSMARVAGSVINIGFAGKVEEVMGEEVKMLPVKIGSDGLLFAGKDIQWFYGRLVGNNNNIFKDLENKIKDLPVVETVDEAVKQLKKDVNYFVRNKNNP